jgi:hypothetical protein
MISDLFCIDDARYRPENTVFWKTGKELTSSLDISSLLKVRPGINPRFFNQKIAAKLPEKKIPSTAAKATILSPNVAVSFAIHLRAQSAFFFTHGNVSIALNK